MSCFSCFQGQLLADWIAVAQRHCPAFGCNGGRALIERMSDVAFSKYQAAEVTISCFNQNVAGLLLYAKLGFRPYAVE
jgi:RimJ/RimL family protein N-acetyltransferase